MIRQNGDYLTLSCEEIMRALVVLAISVAFLGRSIDAIADSPLPPPRPSTKCSLNGKVCIALKPGSDSRVYRKEPDGKQVDLWTLPGWHRAVFVSNNGRFVVKCYDGLNLVPANYDPNMALVEVWQEGVLARSLSLRKVVGDLSTLVRTVSHYEWGSCFGFEGQTRFVLGLSAKDTPGEWRKLVLDVVSGELRRTNELVR